MIYLKNTTVRQMVRVPLTGLENNEMDFVLAIWSTTENHDVYRMAWEDSAVIDGYALGLVTLPAGLPDGEYEYRLSEGTRMLSGGVAQIGDYKAVPVQKGNTTIEFKQYAGRN